MLTILQQGEQDDPFYVVQINGEDIAYYHYLSNAAEAVEKLKEAIEGNTKDSSMVRWHKEQ